MHQSEKRMCLPLDVANAAAHTAPHGYTLMAWEAIECGVCMQSKCAHICMFRRSLWYALCDELYTQDYQQLDEYLLKLCNIFAVQVYKYMCVNYDRMSSSMKMQTASNVKQK